ncbi:MAG: ribonuclease HI [Treponemataceae bacterium]|nr:ribonuclease HI [Treponemataceae bacterium]
MKHLVVFTDGGCSGNPGPGGWAYCLVDDEGNLLEERWGADPQTTNNRMELSATVAALSRVLEYPEFQGLPIILYTDSQYVQKGISEWIHAWKDRGWRTSNKEPVKNRDLWEELDRLNSLLSISWQWVKGHAGNSYNERVDRLTQEAIKSLT